MRKAILTLVLLLAACGGGNDLTTETTTVPPTSLPDTVALSENAKADFEAARARWASSAIDNYQIRFDDDCSECNRTPAANAVVWDEQVVAPDVYAKSVDEVFAAIDDALDDGRTVEVTYDSELGYPAEVWIDREAQAFDGGTHWIISDLEPGLPGDPASLAKLNEARNLWNSLGPSAYEYDVAFVCDCDFAGRMWTRVDENNVVEWEGHTRNPDDPPSPTTIDRLFSDLEELFQIGSIEESGVRFTGSAEYDPKYGFPRWIGIEIEVLVPSPEWEGFPPRIVFVVDHFLEISSQEPGRSEFVAARNRWQERGPVSYTLAMQVHIDEERQVDDRYVVQVEAGEIVSVQVNGNESSDPFYEPVYAINELFDEIELWKQYGLEVEVTYDPTLGHPTEITVTSGVGGVALQASIELLDSTG